MREWNLGAGDPLFLRLAADYRLCQTDTFNDQVWELEPGVGDPPALGFYTTYALRARLMRIYPVFTLAGQSITDPASFHEGLRLHLFSASYLRFTCQPLPGLQVCAEYRVIDSHCVAGRFTIQNQAQEARSLLFQLCGQLNPFEGRPLDSKMVQSVHILAGRAGNLAPVIFLTGGPLPGKTIHPSLAVDLALPAGGVRTLTWTQAALDTIEASFSLARRSAARPWEAELARIELLDEADTIDMTCGDPDLEAAFALSQRAALGQVMSGNPRLPHPTFVLARQPDHGYSAPGDTSDLRTQRTGQPVLESLYLSGVLPGAPRLMAGLVRNALAAQAADGFVDYLPGMGGPHIPTMAPPALANLARRAWLAGTEAGFLAEVFPKLVAFLMCWFASVNDRDQDGFPEWTHSSQMGMTENPKYRFWEKGSQGVNITCLESPMLGALLASDLRALEEMAEDLGETGKAVELRRLYERIATQVQSCRDEDTGFYHLRDRDNHASLVGRKIGSWQGQGTFPVGELFDPAARFQVRLSLIGEFKREPQIVLEGRAGGKACSEKFTRDDFHWLEGRVVTATSGLFGRLGKLKIRGVGPKDRVSLQVVDMREEDIGLLFPLWAGLGAQEERLRMIGKTLKPGKRFWRPFGIPSSARRGAKEPVLWRAVHLPWNTMVGEGWLEAGDRQGAADLVLRLMRGVILSLKKHHAFPYSYEAETGKALGGRNALAGMAPLGLFLKVLGVEFRGGNKVQLSGKNPFPWTVTVKYRGLAVTRHADQTEIVFPDGQSLRLNDPTDGLVAVE